MKNKYYMLYTITITIYYMGSMSISVNCKNAAFKEIAAIPPTITESASVRSNLYAGQAYQNSTSMKRRAATVDE